uniref:Uncharacterized protein n=1 Tax=Callorhinchus milii TaxID=7868 RepID=A0A4W3GRQ1_CALMI
VSACVLCVPLGVSSELLLSPHSGPEVPEAQTGAGTVICALGISLGIISAIVGIILLLKERQRLHSQQRSLYHHCLSQP